jgi:predicted TIM-barrel fold metal-dependent hydrolase
LIAAAPDCLVWATDWPHPDLAGSPMPNDGDLLDAFCDWVPDEGSLNQILVDNPAKLYDFS